MRHKQRIKKTRERKKKKIKKIKHESKSVCSMQNAIRLFWPVCLQSVDVACVPFIDIYFLNKWIWLHMIRQKHFPSFFIRSSLRLARHFVWMCVCVCVCALISSSFRSLLNAKKYEQSINIFQLNRPTSFTSLYSRIELKDGQQPYNRRTRAPNPPADTDSPATTNSIFIFHKSHTLITLHMRNAQTIYESDLSLSFGRKSNSWPLAHNSFCHFFFCRSFSLSLCILVLHIFLFIFLLVNRCSISAKVCLATRKKLRFSILDILKLKSEMNHFSLVLFCLFFVPFFVFGRTKEICRTCFLIDLFRCICRFFFFLDLFV